MTIRHAIGSDHPTFEGLVDLKGVCSICSYADLKGISSEPHGRAKLE
jgi:hypothetical protein